MLAASLGLKLASSDDGKVFQSRIVPASKLYAIQWFLSCIPLLLFCLKMFALSFSSYRRTKQARESLCLDRTVKELKSKLKSDGCTAGSDLWCGDG